MGTKLIEIAIVESSDWLDKTIMEADIPEEILVVMIKRGNEIIIPKGSTTICKDDILVLSGNSFESIVS